MFYKTKGDIIMRRMTLRAVRVILKGGCWLILALLVVSTVIRFFPSLSFLVMPVVITNTVLAAVLIVIWLIFYRCPNCKKLLPLVGYGNEGCMCHHCGERYR